MFNHLKSSFLRATYTVQGRSILNLFPCIRKEEKWSCKIGRINFRVWWALIKKSWALFHISKMGTLYASLIWRLNEQIFSAWYLESTQWLLAVLKYTNDEWLLVVIPSFRVYCINQPCWLALESHILDLNPVSSNSFLHNHKGSAEPLCLSFLASNKDAVTASAGSF